MRGLLVLVVVGACDDQIAIEVVVASPDTTRVELFLAKGGPCRLEGTDDQCPGIGPEISMPVPGRSVLDGLVFHVDGPEPFIADVVDGIATFRVEPEAGMILPAVIAAGYGPNGPDSVAVARNLELAEGPLRIRIPLSAAQHGELATNTSALEPTLQIWPEPTPDRDPRVDTCVGVEREGSRIFIVPRDNPDCDSFESPVEECAPLVFEATDVTRGVALAETTCAFQEPGSAICQLGGPICNEVAGTNQGCGNAERICISNALCDSCEQLDQECLDDTIGTIASASTSTFIKCDVQLEPINGQLVPCLLSNPVPVTFGACDEAQLAPPQLPFVFNTVLDLDDGGIKMSLRFEPAANCASTLHHVGALPRSATPGTTTLLTSFVNSGNKVVLPLVINWIALEIGGCTTAKNPSICALSSTPGDNVQQCSEN